MQRTRDGQSPAVSGAEPHIDDIARPAVLGAADPKATLLAYGAADGLAAPVHRKVGQGERIAAAAALPAHVGATWADQVNAMLGAGSDEVDSADVACSGLSAGAGVEILNVGTKAQHRAEAYYAR